MKVVGAIFADFVEAAPGGPAQLQTPIAGRTILARTLARFVQIDGLAARCMIVRERDRAAAVRAVAESGVDGRVDVLPLDSGARPRRVLLRTARKWQLDAWRGHILGATWFDEFVEARIVASVLKHCGADAVFCFDGHQPLLDPRLARSMLVHLEEHQPLARHVFTQAPPGLAGVVLGADVIQNLIDLNIPYGLLLSFRPELAQWDPITHPSCFHVSPNVGQIAARLTGDTRRSRELLELALRELGDDVDAEALGTWLRRRGHDRAGPLPVEVELELTTSDPLPTTTLRPRGDRVPSRQLDDLAPLARRADELAGYDDRLVFLAGHGDPLQHPRIAEVCRLLRSAGVFGIGLATPLVDLGDESLAALFANAVDLVEVQLDADSAAGYQRVHGRDAYAQVLANIERIERRRREQGLPQPIVVCSLTRHSSTIDEMEGFFDRWTERLGSAVIRGYNEYCGVLPPDGLLPTVPAQREPCRRLASRLMLLADGAVPVCGQDLRGEVRLGDWTRASLGELWAGTPLDSVRSKHERLELETIPICRACHEWFRP